MGQTDMTVFTTNGAKIYIGAAMDITSGTVAAADFTSQTFTQIKEVQSIGTIGDAANEVTFASLEDGRTRRFKGTRDAGTAELTCGLDAADAGQIALKAAEATSDNYAFKVELPDGSSRLFAAMVGTAQEAVSEADNIITLTATLWINSNVVKVAAE